MIKYKFDLVYYLKDQRACYWINELGQENINTMGHISSSLLQYKSLSTTQTLFFNFSLFPNYPT